MYCMCVHESVHLAGYIVHIGWVGGERVRLCVRHKGIIDLLKVQCVC